MMFNVHTENYHSVQGYLVPNGFSNKARIVVTAEGETVFEGACDQFSEGVFKAGRHGSGMVGFELDHTKVPGIENVSELSVFDAETGLLIYRRNDPEHYLQHRVFRLETSLSIANAYYGALGDSSIRLRDHRTAVSPRTLCIHVF